jgi:pyridoxal phosphate enzyme (YggS family)
MVAKKKYNQILDRISIAAEQSGRNPSDIKLVVVSKAQPVDKIRQAIEAGARLFGENYPEESLPKILELGNVPGLRWHMIGHLQSRKIGIVADYFEMLHSLDNVHLAQKLDKQLDLRGRVLPVLLEMNVGGEESKFGWNARDESDWPLLLKEVNTIRTFSHIKICGLMTMPPWNEDAEVTKPFFQKLRRLRDYLQKAFPTLGFNELSMGTSSDFEVAIREGSTYVRIGQAILGDRQGAN